MVVMVVLAVVDLVKHKTLELEPLTKVMQEQRVSQVLITKAAVAVVLTAHQHNLVIQVQVVLVVQVLALLFQVHLLHTQVEQVEQVN
jgi:hypothetical protein